MSKEVTRLNKADELMVFLEMNGYDVSKYCYKKQLFDNDFGNLSAVDGNTLEEVLISLKDTKDNDLLNSNPLVYLSLWEKTKRKEETIELGDFYINNPRITERMTLQELIDNPTIKEDIKIHVIQDQLLKWNHEYKKFVKRTIYIANEWMELMTREVEYFKMPSIINIILSILGFFIILFTINPVVFDFSVYNDAFMNSGFFLFFVFFLILLFGNVIYSNDQFRRILKQVKYKDYKVFQSKKDKTLNRLNEVLVDYDEIIYRDSLISKKDFFKRFKVILTINQFLSNTKKELLDFENKYIFIIRKYHKKMDKILFYRYLIIINILIYLVLGFLLGKGLI
jgi:hypothetical protein